MTTRALEEVDRGLGSCLADEDFVALLEPSSGRPQEDKARVTPRPADTSSWPQVSQESQAASGVDARPKKMEEPMARGTSGPGKEKLKSAASPRGAPVRKKTQATPPAQPPPPPPALSEELPWGDVTLNKCLVLASLVALLGSACQLCRDAVAGEETGPVPAVPPISPPKGLASQAPKPAARAPPLTPPVPEVGPPAPLAEAGVQPEVHRGPEAAEKVQRDPGEAAEEKRATLAEQGPKARPRKERPRKDEKPWKEKPRKERPRKERPQKEERPRAAREAQPRRWEARTGGHRPWAQDSRDPEHRKRQAWASPRRPEEDRPPGRQKHLLGKGRD